MLRHLLRLRMRVEVRWTEYQRLNSWTQLLIFTLLDMIDYSFLTRQIFHHLSRWFILSDRKILLISNHDYICFQYLMSNAISSFYILTVFELISLLREFQYDQKQALFQRKIFIESSTHCKNQYCNIEWLCIH